MEEEANIVELLRRYGGDVGKGGGHQEIMVLRAEIEKIRTEYAYLRHVHEDIAALKEAYGVLQNENSDLKKKVDDFNIIIRPVYEEEIVRLKALVAEARELIQIIGTSDEVHMIEKAHDWLKRSER